MIGLLAKLFIKDHSNYSDPGVRTAYGVLTGIAGIVLNLLLFAGKLVAGFVSSSVSVIADAFNNLSDAGSAVVSIAGYRIAAIPADTEHPYGHGRAEYVAGFIVSASIILAAIEIGKESVGKILSPELLNVSPVSAIILVSSILVKLYIFAYNRRYGKLINSSTMKTVATDSLSDCVSTLSALLAFAVYALWDINIDGYIGLLIAVIILKAGIDAAKESAALLLGRKADDDFIANIRETVMSYDGVIGIHDLAVHNYGVNRNIVSLHAELPASMSFTDAHDLIDMIESDISEKYSASVIIHMDPVTEDDDLAANCRQIVLSEIHAIDENAGIHDFRVATRENRNIIMFDAEVPFGLDISDDEIKKRLSDRIREYDSSLGTSICIDKKIY